MNKMSILLFGLAKGLQFTAWRREDFRNKLKEKDFVIQIKTASGSTARWISIKGGKVTSGSGLCEKSDVALVWKDEQVAFKTMTNRNPKAVMAAVASGDLKLAGKADLALWFGGLAAMMVKGK